MRHLSTRPGGSRMIPGYRGKLRGLQYQRGTLAGGTQTIQAWHTLWDWTGTIKPQLDLAFTAGATSIKAFAGTVAATDGTISRATLLAHIAQLVGYCRDNGRTVYFTLWDGFTDPQANASPTSVGHAVAVAQMLDTYSNIVGFDLGNECISPWCYGVAGGMAHLGTLQPAIKAVTSLPLSVGLSISSASQITHADTRNVAPYCDFMDFHPYYDTGHPTAADFATYRASSWYKPWVVGECGKVRSAGTDEVASRWLALRDLANESDCMGAYGYQILEYGGSVGYGMYPSLGGSAHADMAVPFSMWPAR